MRSKGVSSLVGRLHARCQTRRKPLPPPAGNATAVPPPSVPVNRFCTCTPLLRPCLELYCRGAGSWAPARCSVPAIARMSENCENGPLYRHEYDRVLVQTKHTAFNPSYEMTPRLQAGIPRNLSPLPLLAFRAVSYHSFCRSAIPCKWRSPPGADPARPEPQPTLPAPQARPARPNNTQRGSKSARYARARSAASSLR